MFIGVIVARNLRVKPHLRRWRGRWECMGMRASCLGPTPLEAYREWRFLENSENIRLSAAHTSALTRREMRDLWGALG